MRILTENHEWKVYEFTQEEFLKLLGIPEKTFTTVEQNIYGGSVTVRCGSQTTLKVVSESRRI